MPMGLIRWLKKEKNDSTLHNRRESAPARTLREFDANKTRDDEYNKAMYKFNEWRANERNKRASMDRSVRKNDHRHDNDHGDSDAENSSAQFQSTQNRISNMESTDLDDDVLTAGGGDSYGSSQQTEFFEPMQPMQQKPIYGGRIPRHSLPANMNKHKQNKRTKKLQLAPSTIPEDEVKEFETAHCYENLDGSNGTRTPFNSPPMKFYKQNSNPYAGSTMSQTFDSSYDATSTKLSSQFTCPVKPKRIMLKQKNTSQLTKELSAAHFSGKYKNYEIQSPFYETESDRVNEKPIMGIRAAAMPSSSSNETGDERGSRSLRNRASGQYQVILNKHGDEVEYALPLVEHRQSNGSQFRSMMSDVRYSSDAPNYDDEIFVEDPLQCEQIVGEGFDNSDDSDDDEDEDDEEVEYSNEAILRGTNIPSISMSKLNVMVTDLDKSMDSSQTLVTKRKPHTKQMFCGVNSLPRATAAIQPQRNLLEFFETIRGNVCVCSPNKLKRKATVLRNTCASPMEFLSGTYRKSTVTLRNCSLADADDGHDDRRFIAESVLRHDLDILKRIRHGDIINLMAIACNPDLNEITLVMEPSDYTLHHYLHHMNEVVSIPDSISIVQQIASATLYLQECGLIHSNISSHSVLMCKGLHLVKLTSFELTTDIASDTKAAIERKYKRNSKVIGLYDVDTIDSADNVTKSPKSKNAAGTLHQRYRSASKVQVPTAANYSARSLRDIDTKFLPYCVDYRQQLAVYNYQAPELLINGERFVFPTEGSDVYSLTLVLWELLNDCVPFAIYKRDELNDLYASNCAELPIFEEGRCMGFKQIFRYGFEPDPINRTLTVHHLIKLLDDIKNTWPNREQNQVMHDNSLYGNAVTKSFGTVHSATSKSTTNQPNYDVPKRHHVSKPSENIYENTMEATTSQPITQQSPLNNVTNSTLQRSILDYQKLWSPIRAGNANIYERARTSTLKKRKKYTPTKQTPTKSSPSSPHEPFESTDVVGNDAEEAANEESSPKLNDNISPHSGVPFCAAKGKQKPSMVRNLSYENPTPPSTGKQNAKDNRNSQSLVEQLRFANANQSKTNNSSYQFAIDDYELPQHLIARNNKIRRNTWLSSDIVNTTNNSTAARVSPSQAIQPCAPTQKTPPTNGSSNGNKTLNVTLRIVTKQLTPAGSVKSDSSVASDNSMDNTSPSVMKRIQFFKSLENPNIFGMGGAGNGNKSRRSEISFDEAVKQNRRLQKKTLSAASPPLANNNRQLLKDINDITDEITKCLNNNRNDQRKNASVKNVENNLHVGYVTPVLAAEKSQSKNNVTALVQKLFGDSKNADTDEVDVDLSKEKRNSVMETVQRIENVLQHQQTSPSHNVSGNGMFRKIDNKLLNEKIVNTELKALTKIPTPPKMPKNVSRNSNSIQRTEEMCEKVEEVMQIVGLSECENDAGQPTIAVPTTTTRSNHTVIKRTFYQESFVSGTNVELPQLERMLDEQSPQKQQKTYTTTKSSSSTTKLTTQVTVNLRQFKRRLSDVGVSVSSPTNETRTTRMADVRHSVCGNELHEMHHNKLTQISDASTKDDEKLSQIKNETIGSHAIAASSSCLSIADTYMSNLDSSTVRAFNSRHIQSIEDLYIDDDFCAGMSLAANMKLITNSTDTLDGIDFDLISTRILEQTSESTMTGDLQQKCIDKDETVEVEHGDEQN